jgi:predicted dehydrogenase
MRIGVVGAGAIAQRNARDAAASPEAEVAGVFDVNHSVAREMGRALKVRVFSTFEEMVQSPDVDAVLISVPHHLHRDLTIQAANQGKHVLIEKPMATTLDDAEAILEACRANKVQLTVNYSFRYLAKIREAKRLIDEGAIGELVGVQILLHQFKDRGYWLGARSNSPDDWRASKAKSGGGFLIMTACHAIDYIYFLTGLRAIRIYSEYGTLGSPADVEDIISVSWKFENGAVGNLSASSIMRGTEQAEDRIWGTNGTIVLNAEGLQLYSTRPIGGRRPGKLYRITKFPDVSWTKEWVTGFIKAIRAGGVPPVSAVDGWNNVAFITSAYQSMVDGHAINVPGYPAKFQA